VRSQGPKWVFETQSKANAGSSRARKAWRVEESHPALDPSQSMKKNAEEEKGQVSRTDKARGGLVVNQKKLVSQATGRATTGITKCEAGARKKEEKKKKKKKRGGG